MRQIRITNSSTITGLYQSQHPPTHFTAMRSMAMTCYATASDTAIWCRWYPRGVAINCIHSTLMPALTMNVRRRTAPNWQIAPWLPPRSWSLW